MASAIEVQNISQSFASGFWRKRRVILDGLSLSVPQGAIFGLLGPNGAGKTTLIHLLTGIRKPKAGEIKIFGNSIFTREAKLGLGYLPERPYFYEHLTGVQFLKLFATLSEIKPSLIHSRVISLLKRVGLQDAAGVELKNYSKGMLQRIGIAQAILHEPRLVILDEPMSGLDPIGRKEVRELIRELNREGRTILFSSHVIPDVEMICTDVALLSHKKITVSGTLSQVLGALSGHTIEVAAKSHLSAKDESFVFSEAIDLNHELTKIMSQGYLIRSVTRHAPSLEKLFEGDSK